MARWTLMGAALMLTIGAAWAAAPGDWAAQRERMIHPPKGDVIVIAHRACHDEAPENSVAAVRRCIALGADGVELDVRHTNDGVAVILHDHTVDRTTDGHGAIADLTYAEVSRLRLRAGAGGPAAPLTAEHVPTLDDYMTAAKDRLWLVMDVKDGTIPQTFAAMERQGMAGQGIFFYECASGALRASVTPFWSKAIIFPIIFQEDGSLTDALAHCPSPTGHMAHVKWQTSGYLEQAAPVLKDGSVRLWVATMFSSDTDQLDDGKAVMDPASVWGKQIDAGANMIMTNAPRELIQYLRDRKK
ncbi:glycerophosphodiester phosphodiesterase family protein [Nitrospirillum sp. BR 11752]|uniref:glycerophosphodiester phosphodiesterase family protein n=1 Tax=Nitrospirillum sp. BR 11752 TaxID=3104293 RepID=UPI002EC77986|nr:glycerophosphodiester phosphodiesterase family protein [Nitrospirillum sp. BR 11752]